VDVTQPTRGSSGLGIRSLRALRWNYVGTFTRISAQLAVGIVLARMLGPEPFGLVAIGWLVIGLGTLLSDMGLASALVQRPAIATADIRYAFTMALGAGLALSVGFGLATDAVARLFGRPDAQPVLQALSWVFAAQALGQVSQALLRRELRFRTLQLCQIGSYLLAYVGIGIPMAMLGFGVWSLVFAALVQAASASVSSFVAAPHSVRPALRASQRGLLNFGGKVMGSNIANFAISNSDAAIVGRLYGAADLGLYNRCVMLLLAPMHALVGTLQAVLFPAYSRTQDDAGRLKLAYLASIGVLSAIAFPVFACIAVAPGSIITGLYGDKWADGAVILTPLALGAALNVLVGMGGPLNTASGRLRSELGAQVAVAGIMIPALLWAARYSLATVAWTVAGVYIVRVILVTRIAIDACGATWRDFASALRGPLALALFTAGPVLALDRALMGLGVAPLLRLAADCALGAAIYLGAMLALGGWILAPAAKQALGRAGLPALLRRRLGAA
jgi:PST family polysaccharide transporter